jgi:hypothetical protein
VPASPFSLRVRGKKFSTTDSLQPVAADDDDPDVDCPQLAQRTKVVEVTIEWVFDIP